MGKPKRLKYFKDRAIYSRRITDEHRLVYDMKDDRLRILGCKGHYKENYDK
ncbi:type II toxin-antitoxin system YoeB family toxin [Fusobacterium pseudoperiodonticum]|uniref:type II toxin-antitoxin system YoeB family toxin n=1 Tax=Fusobacterium pseudoperiodonticum TaxID=2663009 RepID=UPI0036F385E9